MKDVDPPYEIIVVDDYSPDGTWRIVEKIANLNSNVKLIVRRKKRGLATAIVEGIQNSKGQILVWMDSDFSQPPTLIPRLIKTLNEYDIALASRYVRGGGMRYSLYRMVASKLINLFAGLFLGFSTKDYTSGFLAIKREVFRKVKIRILGGNHGEYFIALLYDAKRHNFKIKEVPYVYLPRSRGSSKTSPNPITFLKHSYAYFQTILSLRFIGAKRN